VELQEAIESHLAWKHRFFSELRSGKLDGYDSQKLACTEECPLGRWIEQQTWRTPIDHLLARLRTEHQEFHQLAASLVKPGPEELTPTQIMLMEGRMQELSGQIVETLGLLNLRGKELAPANEQA